MDRWKQTGFTPYERHCMIYLSTDRLIYLSKCFLMYIYIYKLVLTFRIWTFPSMIELPHKNPLGEKQPARRWCLYCGIGL